MNKDLRNTIIWLVFATLMLTTALWQAQVAAAKDALASHKTPPPPRQTRHAIRPAPAVFSGDVVADYIARCEKGMTDQKIGWILEDFRNAGLDFSDLDETASDTAIITYRTAQIHWYYDTLVDGLRLSHEQSKQVSGSLSLINEQAVTKFQQTRKKEGKEQTITPLIYFIFGHMVLFSEENEPYEPWNLCTLTPLQVALTKQESFEQQENSNDPFAELPAHLVLKPDPANETLLAMQHPYDENQNDIVLRFFPWLKSQDFDLSNRANLLVNIRKLHPAQLKIILLFYPGLAAELQADIDKEK